MKIPGGLWSGAFWWGFWGHDWWNTTASGPGRCLGTTGGYSMFPRAVAGCGHGFSNCMREQPGETLTAQVSIIPAAATRLSYNSPGPGLEASPRVQVFSINFHVDGCIGSTFWFRAFTFFCRCPPSVPVSVCYWRVWGHRLLLFLDEVRSDAEDSLTLRFPFPSDLNAGLGGRKRRKRNTEAGLVVFNSLV